MPNYLSIKQVAERLNLHTDSVKRRIRNGELVAVDIGTDQRSKLVVSEDDLQSYLDARRTQPPESKPKRKPTKSKGDILNRADYA